jgi:pyridoxal phosphate-dependent aminotransferase EpsN
MTRIYLSPPHVGALERELLLEAFDSNWIAPVGPHLERFEAAMCERLGCRSAVALSSGTAALHLALAVLGVGPGDEVITSTLTFVASANAIRYAGAEPVFVDADPASWCMDPALLARALDEHPRARAVLVVDLYGQCADYDPIRELAASRGVLVVEDAAESLGASYRGRPAATLGDLGALSFNGNKIITTSGGGMLVSEDEALIEKARYLATQARSPAPHYEHRDVGFNYRLSNLSAAIGIAQLSRLEERVERRRAINHLYREALGDLPGVSFMPEAPGGRATFWLTTLTIDPERFGADRDAVLAALAARDIEARPVWKPMHLQPAYQRVPFVGGAVAERLFAAGMCLPSGSSLGEAELALIIETFRGARP